MQICAGGNFWQQRLSSDLRTPMLSRNNNLLPGLI
jgi:hypothetical protein